VTPPRVLVTCVGNTLRGDDGFGIAVAAELDGSLPEEADLIETGIGGIGIVHALMDGYDALVIVDAVERGAQPGTVFVLVPQVPDIATPTFDEWLARLSDCQPETCDDFAEALSAPVAGSVPVAAKRVRELLAEVITPCNSAGAPALRSTPPAGRNGRRGRE
jgi:hydrogenase maturation protease